MHKPFNKPCCLLSGEQLRARGRLADEGGSEHGVFVFRKASLALIRKMVHYSSEVLLKEVCDSESGHNLPTVLVEITATVLDHEVRTAKRLKAFLTGVPDEGEPVK